MQEFKLCLPRDKLNHTIPSDSIHELAEVLLLFA